MFSLFKKKDDNRKEHVNGFHSTETTQLHVSEIIKKALSTKNPNEIVSALKSNYEKYKNDEAIAGWIAGVIGDKGVIPLFPIVEDFVNRFPDSLYSARVIWADFLASQGDISAGSQHARIYLRQAKDSGKFSDLGDLNIIRDGVSRAFCILSAAYSTLGAKSYAKRVLLFAINLNLESWWKDIYYKSIAEMDNELLDTSILETDKKWENFFKKSGSVSELIKLCNDKGFEEIAIRLDLIEGFFRFKPNYKIDEEEMFLIVRECTLSNGKTANALL